MCCAPPSGRCGESSAWAAEPCCCAPCCTCCTGRSSALPRGGHGRARETRASAGPPQVPGKQGKPGSSQAEIRVLTPLSHSASRVHDRYTMICLRRVRPETLHRRGCNTARASAGSADSGEQVLEELR